ncbi:hypothetical protein [Ancylobacter sp.]|uniref:hypothetical protein n=1 Tax=Ancylobacter sp. TaxID=1872567 RepID=UPI003D11D3CB
MSYAEWPPAVPYRPERDMWGVKPVRDAAETQMQGANVRLRRYAGDRVPIVRWGRDLKPDEVTAFRTFIADINDGTQRFLMPVCLNGSTYETRLVQITGGLSEQATPGGGWLTVGFSLLVFPAEMVAPPAITIFDRLIIGTGIAGWPVEIEVDGVARTATVGSNGRFALDGAFLTVGTHAVRIRHVGAEYGVAQNYTIAAAAGGLFDAMSGALWDGYSTSRLLTAWLGAVVRARRFDNAERDFYALTVSPWLVDSTGMGIAEWAGIGPAYVARWYGQKGATRDAVQATASAQPRIVNAGVLDVGPNGRPVLVFSGAQYLEPQNAAGFLRNIAAATYAAISRATAATGQCVLSTSGTASTAVARALLAYSPNSTAPVFQARNTDAGALTALTGATVTSGAWSRLISRARYADGLAELAVNGTVVSAALSPVQNSPNADSLIGVRIGMFTSGSLPLTGGISTVILAQSALDITALNAAQLQVMP